jgi:N6-L-threonylcarbamoyladenine synthase
LSQVTVTTSANPIILAIESSCDETAAAVLSGARELVSSVVHTQVDVHAQYGGVVPELASRSHILAIDTVVEQALAEAKVGLDDIEGIAVTAGPGLVGSLLVGVEYAKAIAWSRDVPLEPVNHLEGHVCAGFLEVTKGCPAQEFPCVALIVSGGHTSLYHVHDRGDYEELGRTLDDAAGEAFDKVSKHLGLGYPGGAIIDDLAQHGRADAIDFPRPMLKKRGYHFSFSGMKTAVMNYINQAGPLDEQGMQDLAASFQEAVAETLAVKTVRAARERGVDRILISGGVACNSRLRSCMKERAAERGISVTMPPPALCTDNAAMIGAAGYPRLASRISEGEGFSFADLNPVATWPIGRTAANIAPVTHGKVRKRGHVRGPRQK